MATEESKKLNLLRMAGISLEVLAAEVWDTLGESAIVLGNGMGDAILEMFEKEQGLELAGENHDDITREVDRIFVDEYGFAREISVEKSDGGAGVIKVHGCVSSPITDKMLAGGMKMNFTCPVMLLYSSLLRRAGMKARVKIERFPEEKCCKISFIPL